jgi:hypothetical protein
MNFSDAAKEVLRAAEGRLAALAQEASAGRDYENATSLLEMAQRVKFLADGKAAPENTIREKVGSLVLEEHATASSDTPENTAPTRSPRKGKHPRFLRDGENLVKVGWSKSEKSEYEHKSPRKVLSALGAVLVAAGAKGRRFSMDKLLPINDPTDGTRLPDYQCYLALALLRENALVIQHGRQGYSLPKKGDLLLSIEKLWEQLPSRG